MRKVLALIAFVPVIVWAQVTPVVPNNTIMGNQSGASAAPKPLTTGQLLFNGNFTYAGASSAANSFVFMPGSALFGTSSNAANGITSPFNIYISGDQVDTTTNGTGNLIGFSVEHAASTNHTGGREAFQSFLAVVGTPALTPGTAGYVGGQFVTRGAANLTGTAGAYGNYKGGIFASNSNVFTSSAATFLSLINGSEFDVSLVSGASAADKFGISIIQGSLDATRGAYDDSAISLQNQDGSSATWTRGISFGGYAHKWAFGADSTLIGAQQRQTGPASSSIALYGVDWRNVTFQGGGAAFISTGFNIDPSGNATAASYTTSGGATISGAATQINHNSNFTTQIGDGTTTSNVTIGGTANTTNVGGPLTIGTAGNVSRATWTTAGVGLSGTAATYTDTSGSGTIATEAVYALPASAIATTAAGVTITNLDTLFLATPAAGTNVTATNLWSLHTQGAIRSGGLISGAAGISTSGATSSINTNSNFAMSINTGTSSGNINIGGGSNGAIAVLGPLTINNNQNSTIGIGIGTDSSTVTIGGGSNAVTVNATTLTLGGSTLVTSTNPVTFSNAAIKLTGITTGTNVDDVCLASDGTVLIQTSTCTISSRRFKDNISLWTENAGSVLDHLPINTFNMKPPSDDMPPHDPNYGAKQIGLIAEDVAEVVPECTIYDYDMKTPKSYRETCLIALLVKAQQEQHAKLQRQQYAIYTLAAWCLWLTWFAMRRRKA